MTEGYAHVDLGGNRQINAVLHDPPRGSRSRGVAVIAVVPA
jgi:hypothetical protein